MSKLLVVLMACAGLATCALATSAADELMLYRGDLTGSQYQLTTGGWGSGACEQVTSVRYNGTGSLRIVTYDFYAGGRIDFGKPADLTALFAKPNTYLELWLRPQPATGTTGMEGETATRFTAMTQMRVVLLTERGQLEAQPVPLKPGTQDRGWWRIDVPLLTFLPHSLATLAGSGRTTLPLALKRMLICGDAYDYFYLGELKIVSDTQAMRANAYPWPEQAAPNTVVTFICGVEPGAATTKVVWDFDSKDGIQEEAVGERVQHIYRQVGTYTVSYIVVDVNGQKTAIKGSFTVSITQ